jgi:hypothetical protein
VLGSGCFPDRLVRPTLPILKVLTPLILSIRLRISPNRAGHVLGYIAEDHQQSVAERAAAIPCETCDRAQPHVTGIPFTRGALTRKFGIELSAAPIVGNIADVLPLGSRGKPQPNVSSVQLHLGLRGHGQQKSSSLAKLSDTATLAIFQRLKELQEVVVNHPKSLKPTQVSTDADGTQEVARIPALEQITQPPPPGAHRSLVLPCTTVDPVMIWLQ